MDKMDRAEAGKVSIEQARYLYQLMENETARNCMGELFEGREDVSAEFKETVYGWLDEHRRLTIELLGLKGAWN